MRYGLVRCWRCGDPAGVRSADEATAVKLVEQLGGRVDRDDQVAGEPVVEAHLNGTQLTDAGLKELKELKQLKQLFLNDTKVTDAGLKGLKEFKEFTTLSLNGTQVTDAGLKDLK